MAMVAAIKHGCVRVFSVSLCAAANVHSGGGTGRGHGDYGGGDGRNASGRSREEVGAEGVGGRGRERGEPARAVVGAGQHREGPPGRRARHRPRPERRRPRRLPRRRPRHRVRAPRGAGVHEEGAGGELAEDHGARAPNLQRETGPRHGCRRGGRRQGGHLRGRGADARRPSRPRQPWPRQNQEGVLRQRERLPDPPRHLPCPGCEAAQTARHQVKNPGTDSPWDASELPNSF